MNPAFGRKAEKNGGRWENLVLRTSVGFENPTDALDTGVSVQTGRFENRRFFGGFLGYVTGYLLQHAFGSLLDDPTLRSDWQSE